MLFVVESIYPKNPMISLVCFVRRLGHTVFSSFWRVKNIVQCKRKRERGRWVIRLRLRVYFIPSNIHVCSGGKLFCHSFWVLLPLGRPPSHSSHTTRTKNGWKVLSCFFFSLNRRFYVVLDDDHSFHRFSLFSLFMPYATTRSTRHIKT